MRTDQTRPILPRGGFQFAGGAGEVRPQQRKALWCADRNSWEPGSIIRRTRERATDMRKSLGAVATALLVLGSVALTASAASAGTPDRTQSCWQELDTGRSLCVAASADLANAVYDAYGIAISTPDGAVGSDVKRQATRDARAGVVALASTVIGIFYENSGYDGASYVASVSQNGCYGYSHGYTNLGSIGWDNRISSFRSYSNCRTAIFANTNYGGSSYGYYTNSSYVGSAMNDQASSIRWAA